eukprot:NODE_258_length_12622_cov_0.213767.p5 type:complete len:142 gc:universal NODE_258_length_12622_cov_0.213767:1318-1743(+)
MPLNPLSILSPILSILSSILSILSSILSILSSILSILSSTLSNLLFNIPNCSSNKSLNVGSPIASNALESCFTLAVLLFWFSPLEVSVTIPKFLKSTKPYDSIYSLKTLIYLFNPEMFKNYNQGVDYGSGILLKFYCSCVF